MLIYIIDSLVTEMFRLEMEEQEREAAARFYEEDDDDDNVSPPLEFTVTDSECIITLSDEPLAYACEALEEVCQALLPFFGS